MSFKDFMKKFMILGLSVKINRSSVNINGMLNEKLIVKVN